MLRLPPLHMERGIRGGEVDKRINIL